MRSLRTNAGDVFVGGFDDGVGEISFGFGEGWDEPGEGAEEICDDGDFSIAGGFSATDADGGDGDGFGDDPCGGWFDGFEDDGEHSGIDEGVGTVEDGLGLFGGFAFFMVSAFFENALWEHTEVAANGNAGLGDGADFFCLADAAFEFHGIGSRGDEGFCGGKGLFWRIVGMDREIRDDQSSRLSAGDGFEMVKDVGDRDVGGVRKTKDHHAERIAD